MAGIQLRDYQLDAVRRMKNGCILCGGVGSGKSRTALAYYYLCEDGEIGTEEYVPMGDPPKDIGGNQGKGVAEHGKEDLGFDP